MIPVPLHLSRLHFPITALGPGRRIGVWFQGCSIRCAGCISADTWALGQGATTVDAVLEAMVPWLPEADGITISGGEPFEQPEAFLALLGAIKSRFAGDILTYTGYSLEVVSHILSQSKGLIDALITDPYDIATSQNLPLRGSDNQTLHCLTTLGLERFREYQNTACHDAPVLDVMFDNDGAAWFAGIPKKGDFARLKHALAEGGHHILTSQDQRDAGR